MALNRRELQSYLTRIGDRWPIETAILGGARVADEQGAPPQRERGPADRRYRALDVGTNATQHRRGGMRNLRADAVAGQHRNACHLSSLGLAGDD